MAAQLIRDTLDLELPDLAKTAVSMLADMERSRGQAVEHHIAQLTILDANLKLMGRANTFPCLDLDQNLQQSRLSAPSPSLRQCPVWGGSQGHPSSGGGADEEYWNSP